MTVADLLRSMSTREWVEWAAFYEVEAEDRARAERRAKSRKGR